MSDISQGPGWWQAADSRWYPPDQAPAPGWWKASDGNWYPPTDDAAAAAPTTASTPVTAATAAPVTAPIPTPVSAPAPTAPPTGSTDAGADAGPGNPTPPYAPAPTSAPGKKRGKAPLILGALAVMLILIAVVGVVVVKNNGSSTSTSGGPTTTGNPSSGNPTTTGNGGGNNGGNGNGGSTDSTVPSGPDELPDKDITLADDVVVVRGNGGSTVKSSATDGSTITLDASAEGVDQLAEGKILLLTGVTVARITSVEKSGSEVTLGISAATLPEVIKDGELTWKDQDVDPAAARLRLTGDDGYEVGPNGDGGTKSTPGSGSSGGSTGGSGDDPTDTEVSIPGIEELEISAPPGFVEGESAAAATGSSAATAAIADTTVSGTVSKFKFDMTHESQGGAQNFHLKLTSSGEVSGTLDVDVKMQSFKSSGNAKVEGQTVKDFEFSMNNLSGTAKIETNLQGLQNVAKIQMPPFFKLPFSLQFPFPIGGIPFTLSVSGTIQVTVSMALANSTLSGRAEIEFGGDAGFHFTGGSATLNGNRTQESKDLISFLKGAAPGPVGVVITTELPKIGLGFGLKQIFAGVFLANGTVIAQDILPAPVACTEMNVAYVLAGGVEARFLGKDFEIARKAIVDKRWQYTIPKTDRCKGTK